MGQDPLSNCCSGKGPDQGMTGNRGRAGRGGGGIRAGKENDGA